MKKILLLLALVFTTAGFSQSTDVGTYGDYSVWVGSSGKDIFMTTTNEYASFGLSKPVNGEIKDGRFILFLLDGQLTGDYTVYLTYDGGSTFVKEQLPFSSGYANITRLVKKTNVEDFLGADRIGIAVDGQVYFFGNDGVELAIIALDEYNPNPFGGVAEDNPFGGNEIVTSSDWVAEYELESLNPFDLDSYVIVFLEDAAANGIDVSHVFDGEISIYFNSQDKHILENPEVIAYTDSLDNDEVVHIVVNPAAWMAASPAKRLAIIYHELGHDVLNLKHKSENGPLMSVYARHDFTFEELFELKNEMFNDYKHEN